MLLLTAHRLNAGSRVKRDPAFPFLSLAWGAQAASLLVSAACRNKSSLNQTRLCERIAGRLPATAGWQPALPRLQSPIYHLPSSIFDFLGGIAQLVERQLCKLEVRGSNPLASSLRSQRSGARSLSRQPCRRRTIFTALSTPGELHFPFLCEFFLIKACLLKYRNQQPISIVPADFV